MESETSLELSPFVNGGSAAATASGRIDEQTHDVP